MSKRTRLAAYNAPMPEPDPTVDLSVVIPAYDEAHRLPATVRTVVSFLSGRPGTWEVIVVSDGSTDDPARALAGFLGPGAPVRLIEQQPNLGKGAAVRRGVLAARGERILFSDADLATPIEELEKLEARLAAGADVAIASRHLPGSRIETPQPFLRRMSGRVFRWLVRASTGIGMPDTQCGFKMFKAPAAREIFSRAREDRFAFDVEVLCVARDLGMRVAAAPVVWRDSGESRVRLARDARSMLRTLGDLAAPGRSPSVLRWQAIGVACAGIVALAALRFWAMGEVPLYDTTEGRYAAIAQEMARRGDWVTPWLRREGQTVPFWGKPPLHFWMTALSFRAFGVGEWQARLPGFLAGMGILAWVVVLGRAAFGAAAGWTAALVAASTLLFFVSWGIVFLDMTTSLCVTGALGSLFLTRRAASPALRKARGYLVFAWLGLGLLAKGPIVGVLVFLPVAAWSVWTRAWKPLRALPWTGGTLLALAVAVPWYLLAERATPGFLRYFFLQEHIHRFLKPDFGDLYGHPHEAFPGMVWLMLAGGFLPWTPFLLPRRGTSDPAAREAVRFFLAWGFAPAVFFTAARSVLASYLLPGVAGLALVAGRRIWEEGSGLGQAPPGRLLRLAALLPPAGLGGFHLWRGEVAAASACGTVAVLILAAFRMAGLRTLPFRLAGAAGGALAAYLLAAATIVPETSARRSAREAARAALHEASDPAAYVVAAYTDDPSLVFYGDGRLVCQPGLSPQMWGEILGDRAADVFVIPARDLWRVPPETVPRIALVRPVGPYLVYREASPPARE